MAHCFDVKSNREKNHKNTSRTTFEQNTWIKRKQIKKLIYWKISRNIVKKKKLHENVWKWISTVVFSPKPCKIIGASPCCVKNINFFQKQYAFHFVRNPHRSRYLGDRFSPKHSRRCPNAKTTIMPNEFCCVAKSSTRKHDFFPLKRFSHVFIYRREIQIRPACVCAAAGQRRNYNTLPLSVVNDNRVWTLCVFVIFQNGF